MTNSADNVLRALGIKNAVTISEQSQIPAAASAIIVTSQANFPTLMRQLEPLSRAGCIILPADPDWVVSSELRSSDAMYCAWKTSSAANYVARCSLRGHYLEFGTFWGRSFFPNYFRFRHWLRGKFFAFDSFCGLSKPLLEETEATGGDFQEGSYASNRESFLALASLVGMETDRLTVVPGFYCESLTSLSDFGIEPKSVSVCYIDCDLYEPTKQVLNFITPALEDGALIYFDDWRLTRASPRVGERAATLEWLAANPKLELIEFDREHWQNQWFIFQRR
jgi:hypothetical protein